MAKPIQPMTEFQRMASERAIALAREMEAAAASAPDGAVISRLESLLLGQGRENQRIMLEQMMQHTADEAVKKGGHICRQRTNLQRLRRTQTPQRSIAAEHLDSIGRGGCASCLLQMHALQHRGIPGGPTPWHRRLDDDRSATTYVSCGCAAIVRQRTDAPQRILRLATQR